MSRIGICGTSSVGKSTLLTELKKYDYFKDYTFCDEVTRQVQAMGLPINLDGDDSTQYAILEAHKENLKHENMITDRTTLDCMCYTTYLWSLGKVSQSCSFNVSLSCAELLPKYDILFFIEPEFDLVDDGVRSTDIKFRNEINDLFKKTIENFDIPVIKLSGTVNQRVIQILESVDENN